MDIETSDMSVRLYNALKNNGINTLEDAAALDRWQLLQLRNFGKLCLRELQGILAANGIVRDYSVRARAMAKKMRYFRDIQALEGMLRSAKELVSNLEREIEEVRSHMNQDIVAGEPSQGAPANGNLDH